MHHQDDLSFFPAHESTLIPPELKLVPSEVTFCIPECERKITSPAIDLFRENLSQSTYGSSMPYASFEKSYLRLIASQYAETGIEVVPFYPTLSDFDEAFPVGRTLAYHAIFKNLEIVSEDGLEWKQVLQFRKDKEAKRKYRAFRLWLPEILNTQSAAEASDLVAKKLDDYQWALKKHGIKTLAGTVSEILDSQILSSVLLSSGIAGIIGGPAWAAIVGGALFVGKVGISLSERLLELDDIKHGDFASIALIQEIHTKFGKT